MGTISGGIHGPVLGKVGPMLLAYDEVNKIPIMKLTCQFPSTGSGTRRLYNHQGKKNTEFHIYIAFTAYDRSRQSNSIYLGKVKMK
jgi:hypothetical protein